MQRPVACTANLTVTCSLLVFVACELEGGDSETDSTTSTDTSRSTQDQDGSDTGPSTTDRGTSSSPTTDPGSTSSDTTTTSGGSDTTDTTTTSEGTSSESESTGHSTDGGVIYHYVLITDLSTNDGSGDHPGVDIDAVAICSGDTCTFASSVEFHGTAAAYAEGALGENTPVDGDVCIPGEFASLGGTNSEFIVGFGADTLIQSGDEIHVYEVGEEACYYAGDDDDQHSVSVSSEVGPETFTGLGTCPAGGVCVIPVP